jgi:hypothetical protein
MTLWEAGALMMTMGSSDVSALASVQFSERLLLLEKQGSWKQNAAHLVPMSSRRRLLLVFRDNGGV